MRNAQVKSDIKQIRGIAKLFKMDEETERDFGDYVEECKRQGILGSKNNRGDFTWDELKQLARDFLGPNAT